MRYFKTTSPIRADQIAQQVFGNVRQTEEIITLNPHIQRAPVIPEGTIVKLPEPKEPQPKGVNLWS